MQCHPLGVLIWMKEVLLKSTQPFERKNKKNSLKPILTEYQWWLNLDFSLYLELINKNHFVGLVSLSNGLLTHRDAKAILNKKNSDGII